MCQRLAIANIQNVESQNGKLSNETSTDAYMPSADEGGVLRHVSSKRHEYCILNIINCCHGFIHFPRSVFKKNVGQKFC